ncbi:glycoside hydrolase family 32 protein [Actinoplanes aureus]|jgi:beta-fructofuranosidase|uniref:beta-fructofuranosidase n=1 Tax=Actinoplanes aureus TaxID=2792083 RepID=A0A931C2X2_9ACTN|nr:glycoside hydrolase family 32 protein [Actinoplanes aureus]MBG0562385.1 glycoside hydrolase family 32 protein [Actinoplanes aureus]
MEPAPRVSGLRPRLHFTPRAGRVGDLFGVLATDGMYHVYYEHRPDAGGVTGWGYATSDDLVLWTERQVVPPPADLGCGTVFAGPGGPTLFFTRAGGGVMRAVADPGRPGWRTDPAEPLISAPPGGVSDLSDPYVFPADGGWRMLLGGRTGGDAGAVVQYRSDDLINWTCDGILVAARSWGCPRLFPLDGAWVLLVNDGAGEEAYAIGDYDGRGFTARSWGVFGRGRLGPAATFLDVAGRRCALARLGEEAAPPGSAWAGTFTLPWILSVRDERLLASPHPHLDHYLINGATGLSAFGGEVRDHGELILTMPAGGETLVLTDADIIEVTVEGVSGLGAARRPLPGPPGARVGRFGSGAPGKSGGHAWT